MNVDPTVSTTAPRRSVPFAGTCVTVTSRLADGVSTSEPSICTDAAAPSSSTDTLAGVANTAGTSLTGVTVIVNVRTALVLAAAQPGPGAPQLSGSPRSLTE